MPKGKFRKLFIIPLSLVMILTLVSVAACTPAETEVLQGILQNVDSANGEVTIVTKDGKTVTLTIATDAPIETEDASSSLGTLEPGASIEVEVDDEGRVAHRVKARQAEIEGNIVTVEGNDVTIETERGSQRTLVVNDTTRIELDEDFPGTIADLKAGLKVEAKFDPTTLAALKIEVKEGEKETGTHTPGQNWGIVEIRVTDPPPADVKSAIVHLSNIEVHMVSDNSDESDNSSGWITVIGAPASFDLMDVIGVSQVLGSANITAGKFTQIRMDVTGVEGETTDNVSYTAEVPGDKLKIVRPFNVGGGEATVLTLDFDGEKSLIKAGDKFLFKPVVKLLIEKGEKQEQREQEREKEENKEENKGGKEGDEEEQDEQKFEGTIDTINGDNWTMTINGESRTIDVSEAEIEGEPAAGLPAEIEGTVVDGIIKAVKVEIKESGG